jgi:hypothetical protein
MRQEKVSAVGSQMNPPQEHLIRSPQLVQKTEADVPFLGSRISKVPLARHSLARFKDASSTRFGEAV